MASPWLPHPCRPGRSGWAAVRGRETGRWGTWSESCRTLAWHWRSFRPSTRPTGKRRLRTSGKLFSISFLLLVFYSSKVTWSEEIGGHNQLSLSSVIDYFREDCQDLLKNSMNWQSYFFHSCHFIPFLVYTEP